MRILVAEDELKLSSFIAKGLRQSAYAVDQEHDGERALALALHTEYDAAVVDVMLPSLDGLSLVRQVRQAQRNFPILILSALATVQDRVRGLAAGADDYLPKPFSFSELHARVQALLRSGVGAGGVAGRLTVGTLELDLRQRIVAQGDRAIELAVRELGVLEYLMRHPGRVVTHNMLIQHVWDQVSEPQINVLNVVVCRLRKKLEDGLLDGGFIHTIRGVGYVFRPA